MNTDAASSVVLALDKNRKNLELLQKFLEKQHFSVLGFSEPEKVFEAVNTGTKIKVALIDIGGFDRKIWDTCEFLRSNDIPFIVISPQITEAISKSSYQSGASNVLKKPLQIKQLISLIASFFGDTHG